MDELAGPLAAMRSAWMSGRSALDLCPDDWRAALGDGAWREGALAALVGHATAIGFRPTPAEALAVRPPLPRLALPTVRDALRLRFRRAMAIDKGAIVAPLLALLTARGFTAHPADWLPSGKEDWAPDVYAPWLAWVNGENVARPQDALSLKNWDLWSAADRRRELADMRHRDPEGARAMLEAKAGSEPAERRARLLEILETKLGQTDAPYLEQLAALDRSERVRLLAQRLLARLGRAPQHDGAAELASMVEVGRVGILRRRTRLQLKSLKTGAQNARRRELLGLVSLAGLAMALGVRELDLLEAAPVGSAEGVDGFVRCVAQTGSDAARRALLDAFLADDAVDIALAAPLAMRLSADESAAALTEVIVRDGSRTFDVTLGFAMAAPGRLATTAIFAAPAFRSLLANVTDASAPNAAAGGADYKFIERALVHLGLLASAAAARAVVDRCVAAGLSSADPRLDVLHLNAALTPESNS